MAIGAYRITLVMGGNYIPAYYVIGVLDLVEKEK